MKASWLAAAAALVCAVGCSDLDSPNETYQQVFDLEPELPENWKCLDDAPIPVPPQKPAVSYTAFVPDYGSQMPVPFTARACLITDPSCMVGVAEGVPTRLPISPVPGFTVTVPATFEGFVRLTAPNYLLFDYYIGGPMVEDKVATQPFSMVSATSAGEFLADLGANPMEAVALGIMAVQIFDCNQDAAPGVKLLLPDAATQPALQAAQPFATQDRIPRTDRPTDSEGIAGFINLPLGTLTVEAEVLGRRFGSRAFRIQPGRLTSGTIRPSAKYTVGY